MTDDFLEPDYEESIPRARFPDKYKQVEHRTETGEIVIKIYGKNAPTLIYAESNKFVSAMLSKGFAWWLIESKLKDGLNWVHKKNGNYASLRTLLGKILNEL